MKTVYRVLLGFAACGSALLLAGCRQNQTILLTDLVRNSPYHVAVTVPESLRTGTSSTLLFSIEKNGKPVTVETEHRMIHVILSSEDFSDLHHSVAPAMTGNGTYAFQHVFTTPGRYRIWIEISDTQSEREHGKDADLIASTELAVVGERFPAAFLIGTEDRADDGLGNSLVLESSALQAGTETVLHLSVEDTHGTKIPLTLEDPIVYGMTGPGLTFFQHGHAEKDPDALGVSIPVTPPAPGTYAVVTQARFLGEQGFGWVEGHFLLKFKP